MRSFALLLLLCTVYVPLFGQQRDDRDSLVRLIHAESAELEEIDGVSYRKITGPARFLHNKTYLLCDTALWNVSKNVIDAYGNVKILQGNTTLVSDRIEYIIDENLAQFRGNLVELFDNEGNILRTNFLDYNTKDSIAFFYNGGSMKGNDGNLIESLNGNYVSGEKMFSFVDNVQMFTDSTYITSDLMSYDTQADKVIFYENTTAWQDKNRLYTDNGCFEREYNRFTFNLNSYISTEEQELWADSLIYDRNSGVAELFDNIQVLDTVQQALAFADYAIYKPDERRIMLTKKPSVAIYTLRDEVNDTTYMSADSIVFYTMRYYDIDSAVVASAKQRKQLIMMDPVGDLENRSAQKLERMKNRSNMVGVSAEEASQRAAENEKSEREPLKLGRKHRTKELQSPIKGSSSIGMERDTILQKGVNPVLTSEDSLSTHDVADIPVQRDSTVTAPDTTSVSFINAWRNVKLFKENVQARADTLIYTGVDSIARLYNNPILWNDIKNQLTADSMQILFKDGALYKSSMISNAFIAAQEDSVYYNQAKGLEMMAFFKDNDIYRFDALGGSSMIFCVREDSLITMLNHKECKIISAHIKEREIQKIKYFEAITNDLKPVYNLTHDDRYLRGFVWRADERPVAKEEVCDRLVKKSERTRISAIPFPTFPVSETYFPQEREAILRKK